MVYLIFLVLLCFLFGVIGVSSNPGPIYGVVGLVVGALGGGVVLIGLGDTFIGLVLLLIYLGGMLVVFAYSVAMAAEPYPETWQDSSVLVRVLGGVVLALLVGVVFVESVLVGLGEGVDCGGVFNYRSDLGGVVMFYSLGGLVLLLCGWVLMVALLVVLELVRVRGRGGLRVP